MKNTFSARRRGNRYRGRCDVAGRDDARDFGYGQIIARFGESAKYSRVGSARVCVAGFVRRDYAPRREHAQCPRERASPQPPLDHHPTGSFKPGDRFLERRIKSGSSFPGSRDATWIGLDDGFVIGSGLFGRGPRV